MVENNTMCRQCKTRRLTVPNKDRCVTCLSWAKEMQYWNDVFGGTRQYVEVSE